MEDSSRESATDIQGQWKHLPIPQNDSCVSTLLELGKHLVLTAEVTSGSGLTVSPLPTDVSLSL